MVEQTTRPMTSSPVVCLIGETEALHFTPHNHSFPHSYTSQSVLPSLLHLTVSHSLTLYTSLSVLPCTPTPHLSPFLPPHLCQSFPHSYTSVSPFLNRTPH
ncbi:hypothetical protein Hamer_G032213, partial [Homarus americanus]